MTLITTRARSKRQFTEDFHDQKTQQQESRVTADRRGSKSLISKDRNAPIGAVEEQLIKAEHHAL